MNLEVGQKVKHPVNNSIYGSTSNGYLYGTVKNVFDNGAYRISTKTSEIVLRDIERAVPISDEEFFEVTQSISKPTQTTTTTKHSTQTTITKPTKTVEPKQKTVRVRNTEGPTKKELAKELYDKMVASGVPFTRNDLKQKFQTEIGLTVAGSTTYSYYFM